MRAPLSAKTNSACFSEVSACERTTLKSSEALPMLVLLLFQVTQFIFAECGEFRDRGEGESREWVSTIYVMNTELQETKRFDILTKGVGSLRSYLWVIYNDRLRIPKQN